MGAILQNDLDPASTFMSRDRSTSGNTDTLASLSPSDIEQQFFDGPFFGLEDNAIPTHMRGEAWKYLILGSSSLAQLDDDDDAAPALERSQPSYAKFTQMIEDHYSTGFARDHPPPIGHAHKQFKGDIGRICFALGRNVKLQRQQAERNIQNRRLLSRLSMQRISSTERQRCSPSSVHPKFPEMSLPSATNSVTDVDSDAMSTCSSMTSISSTASTCGSTISSFLSRPGTNASSSQQQQLVIPSRMEFRLDHIMSAYLNFHYTETYSALLVHMCVPFAVSIPDEYDAFCCFDKFMSMRDTFFSEADIHARLSRFMMLLRSLLPDLYNHLEEEDIRFQEWAVPWIEGFLCRELPLQCLLHLWGRYFTLSASHALPSSSSNPNQEDRTRQDEHSIPRNTRQYSSSSAFSTRSNASSSTTIPSDNANLSSTNPLDLHIYVCLSIMLSQREALEDLDHAEILSTLKKLPHLNMDQIVSQALRLCDEYKDV